MDQNEWRVMPMSQFWGKRENSQSLPVAHFVTTPTSDTHATSLPGWESSVSSNLLTFHTTPTEAGDSAKTSKKVSEKESVFPRLCVALNRRAPQLSANWLLRAPGGTVSHSRKWFSPFFFRSHFLWLQTPLPVRNRGERYARSKIVLIPDSCESIPDFRSLLGQVQWRAGMILCLCFKGASRYPQSVEVCYANVDDTMKPWISFDRELPLFILSPLSEAIR